MALATKLQPTDNQGTVPSNTVCQICNDVIYGCVCHGPVSHQVHYGCALLEMESITAAQQRQLEHRAKRWQHTHRWHEMRNKKGSHMVPSTVQARIQEQTTDVRGRPLDPAYKILSSIVSAAQASRRPGHGHRDDTPLRRSSSSARPWRYSRDTVQTKRQGKKLIQQGSRGAHLARMAAAKRGVKLAEWHRVKAHRRQHAVIIDFHRDDQTFCNGARARHMIMFILCLTFTQYCLPQAIALVMSYIIVKMWTLSSRRGHSTHCRGATLCAATAITSFVLGSFWAVTVFGSVLLCPDSWLWWPETRYRIRGKTKPIAFKRPSSCDTTTTMNLDTVTPIRTQ